LLIIAAIRIADAIESRARDGEIQVLGFVVRADREEIRRSTRVDSSAEGKFRLLLKGLRGKYGTTHRFAGSHALAMLGLVGV
jgi:hypothetical protein